VINLLRKLLNSNVKSEVSEIVNEFLTILNETNLILFQIMKMSICILTLTFTILQLAFAAPQDASISTSLEVSNELPGVIEIVGVRVPDSEEDHTNVYRNAQIVNNKLVARKSFQFQDKE
jgi:hypothetical protein